MTTTPFATDPRLAQARAHARAGAWAEVLGLLAPVGDADAAHGELVTLYGEALLYTGRAREARAWLRRAEPALVAARDAAAHRAVLNLLGAAHFFLGELDDAAAAFGGALERASQHDDLLLVARATNNLGAIANIRGERETALAHYALALPVYQRLGRPRELADSHHNMAITFRDLGELDRADEHERRALEFADEGEVPRLAAMARTGRAELALRRGDARFAEATARRAADELARLADAGNEADARRVVGAACLAQGRLADARLAFDRALATARAHAQALPEAETLRDRSRLAEAEGDRAAAAADAHAALEIFRKLGAVAEVGALEERLARGIGD